MAENKRKRVRAEERMNMRVVSSRKIKMKEQNTHTWQTMHTNKTKGINTMIHHMTNNSHPRLINVAEKGYVYCC